MPNAPLMRHWQCRPRSDAAERGVRSGSALFALRLHIFFTKHDNNNNEPDTLYRK